MKRPLKVKCNVCGKKHRRKSFCHRCDEIDCPCGYCPKRLGKCSACGGSMLEVSMIEFNVNDYIFVKLTDAGRAELKRQHDELNKEVHGALGEYIPPVEDSDGWSKWQMHSIMNRLGHMMLVGFNDIPFETTIRIVNS